MKNFKPQKIIQHKRSEWLKLGGKLVTRIIEDADKGISQDSDGKPFPPYSKRNADVGWRTIKTKGGFKRIFIDSYHNLKKSGKAAPKGVSSSRQVSPPNLRLTGTMLGSISPKRATTKSVEIHYREGEKVQGNANPPSRLKKGKRNIYGLNDKNWDFAKDYIDSIIDEKITKFNRKKVILEVKI